MQHPLLQFFCNDVSMAWKRMTVTFKVNIFAVFVLLINLIYKTGKLLIPAILSIKIIGVFRYGFVSGEVFAYNG